MTDVQALTAMDPEMAADELVRAHEDDPDWIANLTDALKRRIHQHQIRVVLDTWAITQAELAEAFGVTRQALAKWLHSSIPSERRADMADLLAATNGLLKHLKPETIPAVVRRKADAFDGRSLLDMLHAGEFGRLVASVDEMFDFAGVGG